MNNAGKNILHSSSAYKCYSERRGDLSNNPLTTNNAYKIEIKVK